MKKIKLANGKSFALVDDEDYEELSQYRWNAQKWMRSRITYAQRSVRADGKRGVVLMHRQVMDAAKGSRVDHINHNGLDNRRCNLRFCTHSQNLHNSRKQKGTTSKYKGVIWDNQGNRWRAGASFKGKTVFLGSFHDEESAARAYNDWLAENAPEFGTFNDV